MAKCYWNFFGVEAEKVAQHFDKHLREFFVTFNMSDIVSGVENHPQGRAARTWCEVNGEERVTLIKEKLKPNLVDG